MSNIYFLLVIYLLKYADLSESYSVCTTATISPTSKIVETFNGKIQGECYTVPVIYSNNTNTSADIYSWLSIPYAEPPINENRFKNPIAVKNWNETKMTTKLPNECWQTYSTTKSEDCLYLNVFVRSDVYANKNNNLSPILIFIHGGDLTSGSSATSLYDPSTLVAMSGIIVVTINYRLDLYGFLYLEGTDATGNQGLLDQTMAFKWVYENARAFGGDPTKITLSGESSGGDAIGLHLLYPASWPYFRNGIMQSGGATAKSKLNFIRMYLGNKFYFTK